MIGSGRKVLSIFQQLEVEGVQRESLQRVFAPIGLEISAATPEEIAISIAAELIAIRHHCAVALPHLRNHIRKETSEPSL
jgi:xanthine dehydrogenase accessory factor